MRTCANIVYMRASRSICASLVRYMNVCAAKRIIYICIVCIKLALCPGHCVSSVYVWCVRHAYGHTGGV